MIERYAPQLAYWRSGPDDGGHAAEELLCITLSKQSPFAACLPQIDAAIATYTADGTTDALIAEHANR